VCVQYEEPLTRDRLLRVVTLRALHERCRALLLCPDDAYDSILETLQVDPWIAASLANGTIDVRVAESAYRRAGQFDAEQIIAACQAEHAAALASGHAGLWLAGDLSWTAADPAVTSELPAHERLIGRALARPTLTRLCLYHAGRFDEDVLGDVAAEHTVTVRV
jgi:hypothetical protein